VPDNAYFGYSEDYGDVIYWKYTINPMIAISFYYTKIFEVDSEDGMTDSDYDYYGPGITFTWSTGSADAGVALYANRNQATYVYKEQTYRPTFNIVQSFGPFKLAVAIDYRTGKMELSGMDDITVRSMNYQLVAEYKEGPLLAHVGYFHADGDPESEDVTGKVGVGSDFDGLLIMFSTDGDSILPAYSAAGGLGINIVLIYVEYKVQKGLWVQVAMGWAQFAHEPMEDVSKSVGWELDFGLSYQLARNLVLVARFGMFTPGGYFTDLVEGTYGDDGETGTHWKFVYKVKLSLD
jgi:hypothetical protein